MSRRARLLVLCAILVVVVVILIRQAGPDARTPEPERPAAIETVAGPRAADPRPATGGPGFEVVRGRNGAVEGTPPTAGSLRAARDRLREGGTETSCGPYAVWTEALDEALMRGCRRAVSDLDLIYEERYGVRPSGPPREAIFLFADLQDYRSFADGEGLDSFGYSAHAIPGRGYVAIWDGDRPDDEILKTLVHEIAHLQNRRALGTGLPRWLDEGLADGLGDTASASGLASLEGAAGAEGQLRRLREAYASGRAGSVRRLVSLENREFDRGTVSFDYEQSAFLVRYLLSEPRLADGFAALLAALAAGEFYSPELLTRHTGRSWEELDRGLRDWVEKI